MAVSTPRSHEAILGRRVPAYPEIVARLQEVDRAGFFCNDEGRYTRTAPLAEQTQRLAHQCLGDSTPSESREHSHSV
jgi:hypothetical protein